MKRHHPTATLSNYLIGYISSIILTLAAYEVATAQAFSTVVIASVVSGLAIIQFAVQLVFFLHLGRERSPKWQLYIFAFMLMIVAILVGGSYWIMDNLNYNMMHNPTDVNTYLHQEDGF